MPHSKVTSQGVRRVQKSPVTALSQGQTAPLSYHPWHLPFNLLIQIHEKELPRDSTSLHGLAESMSLLHQAEYNSGATAEDLSVATAPVQQDFRVPQRLEVAISQCVNEVEIERELWDDLDIQHRSATSYMRQYLDCLQQNHSRHSGRVEEIDDFDNKASPMAMDTVQPWQQRKKNLAVMTDFAAREVESNATTTTREEWRLKIACDSLVRDLLAMQETLECLKLWYDAPSQTKSVLLPSVSSIGATAL